MASNETALSGKQPVKRPSRNRWLTGAEIVFLFLIALAFIKLVLPFAGDNPLYLQMVLWAANIFILIYIWLGLKFRGENWGDLGLTFHATTWKNGIRTFLLSLLVFVLAMVGFLFGSVIMANITGIPEQADMSGYEFLRDNIWLFLLTLGGVYIVSSFGEEVIYRAFLINRISEIGGDTRTASVIAIVISSIIFGLIHYEWGPMGMVQTGFMGLVLGICYIKLKKRLWILILAHAYMDTILIAQIYLASNP